MDEWGALDFQSLLADRPGMKAYRNELYHSLSVRGSDIIEKNGVQRRRLSFALPDDLGSETWVAGIGDARWGILMPRYDISLTDERQLVFVSCQDGDKTLFRSEDFSMSGIGSGVTVYRPLVETGKKWIYKGSNDVTGQTWVVTMELKGDTLVAGKNCLKLYGYNLRNNGQDEYLGALMEKNRVVSCFLPGKVEPDTLYDFGLQVGDEGAFFCSDDNKSFDMTNIGDFYDVVDGALVHGVMMYYPESSQSWSMMNLWIEGAGSVYGVLQPCFGDRVGGESMTLRWCGFNSRQIYRAIGFADDLKVEIDGIYYNLNSTNKVAVVTTKPKFYWEVEEVVIPESVTYEGVKYSVTSIDRGTFEQCDKLTSVVIPNSVTSIGDAAFGWCGSLTSVSFGNSVKSIGEFAFHNCYSLTSVEIPNSVTTIGDAAFGNCKGLTSLVLSNGLTNIGNQVFAACESLTSVDIPNSVDTISSLAFAGCRSLTSLNIPNSVSYIGQNAFSSCTNLTSLTIGNGVNEIINGAFGNCSKLADIYCYAASVPKTGNEVFDISNYMNATLHVPAASLGAYQTTEPWSNFKEIVALKNQDDQEKPNDYIPFVEMNKGWEVVISYDAPYYGGSFSEFGMEEEVERDGKTYVHAKRVLIAECEVQEAGLFREENRRVYKYDEKTGKDIMMYDFSLKEGDTFTYEFGFDQPVNCKVLKQGWLTDGPQIATSCTLTSDGTLDIEYRSLHTWTIGRDNGSGEYEEMATWVECIGALENVFGLIDNGFRKFDYSLAFLVRKDNETSYDKNRYLPFSFCDKYMHGCNLPTGEEELAEDTKHHLTYELEGDRLHVYGDVFTQCGPYNYAYFYERKTDDPLVHTIEFMPWEVLEVADCMSLRATDFYVPGFDPDLKYIVIDNRGEEHAVINKMAYRPFVEEGKVWKVGSTTGIRDGIVKMVEYYYFEGDTIIDGKTCKQMMCQRYVSPDSPEYNFWAQKPSLSKVGAWYEEDKKVYYYDEGKQSMKMMYDFSLNANDTLQFLNVDGYPPLIIGPKQTGGLEGFKGVYRDIMICVNENQNLHSTFWLEGVGSIMGPITNTYYYEKIGIEPFLMSCAVGDEVIYLNDEYDEEATPEGAKKGRFDFTHTIKIQPKAPARRGAERKQTNDAEALSVYGEYNEKQLCINLDPLDAAYQVSITDESGKTVYGKAVNALNIVALDIDISTYAEGRYTVTVENAQESFTGEFEVQTTGIKVLDKLTISQSDDFYDLQGRKLSNSKWSNGQIRKGIYVKDGRKFVVK
jgi:hypothetical protein